MFKRIVLALAPLLLASAAEAQEDLQRVDRRLEQIASASALQGYRLDGQAMNTYAVSGMLRTRESVTLVLELWAGRSYRITGVCDRQCANVDLSLEDPSDGAAVAEDRLEDSVPLLEFTASTTGPHLLSVEMRECTEASCYFGVRILSK